MAVIFGAVTLLYTLTRSLSLDEWDSINFALGVTDYNLFLTQPHPPGYPLYIFSGWIFTSLFKMSPVTALTLTSCLGGGLFAAAWYGLVRRAFDRTVASASTAALAILPALWMTATKVLTDSASSACLALELIFAALFIEKRTSRHLVLTAVLGTAASGFRPQNTLIALIILLFALDDARVPWKRWAAGIGLFLASALLWLIPVMVTQAGQEENHAGWKAYPYLLIQQWNWRLDKPEIYVGAEEVTARNVADRVVSHARGWFTRGFGMDLSTPRSIPGLVVLLAGWILFFVRRAWRGPPGRPFWKVHLPWALIYAATIFIALPADVRYLIPIFPLLVIPPILGLARLKPEWRWIPWLLPAALLVVTLPHAWANHREDAPPLRVVMHLKDEHPPAERSRIYLYLTDSRRHAWW